MKGWQVKKIGEVCTLKSGTTVNKNLEEISGDIPYLKVADLNIPGNNPEIVTSSRFLNQKSLKENSIFPVGTTIFPKRGGAILTNKKRLTTVPICTDLNIMGVIPSNILLPKFLYFYFLNIDMRELGSGSSIPQINNYDIEPLIISFPPLPEQKRIVAILDEAFEGIDKAITNNKKNLANSRELFESYLKGIFTQRGEGWKENRLGNLSEVQSGGTPLCSKPEYWGGQIAWYSSGELNNLYTTAPERNITDEGLKNSNAKLFPKGSLLMGMYDTAALKMSILDREATFNQAIAGVRPNEKIDLIFILHAINFLKPEILNLRRGVRQKNLSLQKIKDIILPLPELKEQQRVVRDLASIREETQRLEAIYRQKIAALSELKQSILQKAFTGELTADTPKTVKEELAA